MAHWKDRMPKGDGWPDEDGDDLTSYIKDEIEKKGLSPTNLEMNLIRVFLDPEDKMRFEIASTLPYEMGLVLRQLVKQLLDKYYPLDDNQPPDETDQQQDQD